jgi:magnesium transporter
MHSKLFVITCVLLFKDRVKFQILCTMSELKYYYFSAEGFFHEEESLADTISASQEGGYVWLDYYRPAKDDLASLPASFGLHPLSIEDCIDANQVPKIEHFPNNTFIIFNAFTYANKTLYIDEINLFIGKNFLITISGINSDTRRPFSDIKKIVTNDSLNAKGGPAFLMHVVVDYVVDQKFQAFDSLEDELDWAEEGVLDNPSAFNPNELMRLRKDLLNLRKSLFHEREILVKICRLDCPFIGEKAIFHYRDIYDHLAKIYELSETYREIVTNLMELYTSLLNNLMTKASNETNASVRRLTLIATVFMPLTLLASIGGMSEWSMMTGPQNWKLTYPLFLIGMVVIAVINYYLIRRIEKKNRLQPWD